MNNYVKKLDLSLLQGGTWLIFFISFVFPMRAVSSIAICLLVIMGILKISFDKRKRHSLLRDPFLICCTLFYILQLAALFYTSDRQEALDQARIKSALIFIPLAASSTAYIRENRDRLFLFFIMLVSVACLYCLTRASITYVKTHDTSVFFYHDIVQPIRQHAVFFSILVFISIVYIMEYRLNIDRKKHLVLFMCTVCFLAFFLFLLSSKLVIVFFAVYMLFFLLRRMIARRTNKQWLLVILILFVSIAGVLSITSNPVRNRFRDITSADTKWMEPGPYTPADYFNGLQFRLLQFKLVTEILDENNGWLKGVTPGDAQKLLDKKYVSRNMFQGDPAKKNDRGYLGYHTHNQFLQSLLQSGVPGLFIFILVCFSMARIAAQEKSWMARFVIALLITWALTDAVFETQYALLIFTFFPVFMKTHKKSFNKVY
jgi:O-antigen ligase